MSGPLGLTQQTAERTGTPSDLRTGTVLAVTARGIDVQVATGLVEGAAHLASYNPAVGDAVSMISYANSWLVLGRAVGPGTAADLATPGIGVGSTVLDGMALSGANVDLATSTGAQVTVPRYGLSFYHPPNHWVLLMLTYNWYSTVANDVMTTRVIEAGGTTIGIDNTQGGAGGIGNVSTLAVMAKPSLGGAKRTWSLTVQRFSGTGTVRIYDPSNRFGSWIAYDLGDQAMIRTV